MAVATIPGIRVDKDGVAWIENTTTKVVEIVLNQRFSGLSGDELAAEMPHLSPAQVEAALAYYGAHREDLDADIEMRRQWVEEMRPQEPKPLSRSELLARAKPAG